MNFEEFISHYDYGFPKNLIATKPASPRDSAKLLVYSQTQKTITHAHYWDLIKFLPEKSVLVLNQTKVVPARLHVKKETGGKATLLYISHDNVHLKVLSDRRLQVGQILSLKQINFRVIRQENQFYLLKPSFALSKTFTVLEKFGQTPLPPYIKNPKLSKIKIKSEYQTVFAKHQGSVAAPTASLHFTKELLNTIARSGIKIVYVTLHVNLGTFASLTETQIKTGKLHSEWYEIDTQSVKILEAAKKKGQNITAVGTTVVRTLESASDDKGKIIKATGTTNLFIQPGYKFKFVDELITNFHVPKSSLLMLVASLIGREQLLSLYKLAIAKKYRLFSFGDGMYIKK